MRILISAMVSHHPNPNIKQAAAVARRVVREHPDSFEDRTDDGERMGSGYCSLTKQLKNRVEHINRK